MGGEAELFGTAFADPAVSEVMVNGPGWLWVERHGRLERLEVSIDREAIDRFIETTVSRHGRQVDRSNPVVDTRLADGSRVSVVVPPIAIDGPVVTIRRFRAVPVELSEMGHPEVVDLLDDALHHRLNFLVVGATGSGKTTVLNALFSRLDSSERLITVEDAAELNITAPHVVRLEARRATADGVGEVTIRDLVRAALRMRPDRIVVGEVRGAEAADMCQAMYTGHDGSGSTCHGNGPADALARLESMVVSGDQSLPVGEVRRLIGSAIDLVVWVRRTHDERREIVSIHEVLPGEALALHLVADSQGRVAAPTRSSRRFTDRCWSMPQDGQSGEG